MVNITSNTQIRKTKFANILISFLIAQDMNPEIEGKLAIQLPQSILEANNKDECNHY